MHPRCRCVIIYREIETLIKNPLQINGTNGNIRSVNKPMELTERQKLVKSAEDRAYNAITPLNFGFNKMLTQPNWAKELAIVNAAKDVVGLERSINCQRCVVAHEARMRGYDVIARPSWGFDDPMRINEGWLSTFDYSTSEIRKCKGNDIEEVINSAKELIKSFGEGSRAVVMFDWNNNRFSGGHVIVSACFVDGAVNFGDPQDGSRAAANKLKLAKLNSVYVLRIDNLKFTDIVKRCCMNRGDKL